MSAENYILLRYSLSIDDLLPNNYMGDSEWYEILDMIRGDIKSVPPKNVEINLKIFVCYLRSSTDGLSRKTMGMHYELKKLFEELGYEGLWMQE